MLVPIIVFSLFTIIQGKYTISLFADVYKDRDFFQNTYPWIIDNVGGEIQVDYYLLGSGRYTVPQMCALEQLRDNPFVQAQYLKCEAEGKPSTYCLCESGIEADDFKRCVRHEADLASTANYKYLQLKLDTTPIFELGPKSTVFNQSPNWLLKKICTIFGDFEPLGCVRPFTCNGTMEMWDGKGIAQFDKECILNTCEEKTTTTTTSTTAYPPSTLPS